CAQVGRWAVSLCLAQAPGLSQGPGRHRTTAETAGGDSRQGQCHGLVGSLPQLGPFQALALSDWPAWDGQQWRRDRVEPVATAEFPRPAGDSAARLRQINVPPWSAPFSQLRTPCRPSWMNRDQTSSSPCFTKASTSSATYREH